MKDLPFWKMSGSGNDFIIIDNRQLTFTKKDVRKFVSKVCKRSLSVGADGVIFIEPSDKADFKWDFYNSDGSTAEMCGNGSRCAARYAFLNGISGDKVTFESIAGIISAEITDDRRVKVKLTKPYDFRKDISIDTIDRNFLGFFVNTGVPHTVVEVDDVENFDVKKYGNFIRFHSLFAPKGTNVNFCKVVGKNLVKIRTYERGVEDETLACGTGSAAVAYVLNMAGKVSSPVKLTTSGGMELIIHIEKEDIFLEGEARIIYKGTLTNEAYEY
ncbi:MAG: diaminopimelate epimerase [Calditerrivibrio sp.]|nr:diaminopimelate epimerase [Calditerrivibrio sp.]MCA1981103.1 diaminopimelate epimerase [Calditerrivibrio sp.]